MDELKKFALEIRIETLNMLSKHGFGHVGGSLSIADALAVLYGKHMKYDPKNPKWEDRDYLVLSKGHCGPALYSTLAIKGFFPGRALNHQQARTRLPSHTDKNLTRHRYDHRRPWTGCILRVGMALGLKLQGKKNIVYSIIGDGKPRRDRFGKPC